MYLEKLEEELRSLTGRAISEVKSASAQGRLGLYQTSELSWLPILSYVLDLPELEDLNRKARNFPALDLGDFKKRVAIQVTKDVSPEKLYDTLKKYSKYGLNKYFDEIYLFYLVESGRRYRQTEVNKILPPGIKFILSQHVLDPYKIIERIGLSKIEHAVSLYRLMLDGVKDEEQLSTEPNASGGVDVGDVSRELKKQIEALVLSDAEKTEIIRSQQQTIHRLLTKRDQSGSDSVYDDALEALAKGDPSIADQLLDGDIQEFEEEAIKVADIYLGRGSLWFAKDTNKALEAYKRGKELNPESIGGWNQLGRLYLRIGDFENAIYAFQRPPCIEKKDPVYKAISYSNIGAVYRIKGDFSSALEYFERALKLNQNLKRSDGVALALSNIAKIKMSKGRYKEAENLFQGALLGYQLLGSKEGLANTLNDLASAQLSLADEHSDLGFKELALSNLVRSKNYYEELKSTEGVARTLNTLGTVFVKSGQPRKAALLQHLSLGLYQSLYHKAGEARCCLNLGSSYLEMSKFDVAEFYISQALSLAEKHEFSDGIVLCYRALGVLFHRKGDSFMAESYFLKAKNGED